MRSQTAADLAKVVHVVETQYPPFEIVINRGKRHGLKARGTGSWCSASVQK